MDGDLVCHFSCCFCFLLLVASFPSFTVFITNCYTVCGQFSWDKASDSVLPYLLLHILQVRPWQAAYRSVNQRSHYLREGKLEGSLRFFCRRVGDIYYRWIIKCHLQCFPKNNCLVQRQSTNELSFIDVVFYFFVKQIHLSSPSTDFFLYSSKSCLPALIFIFASSSGHQSPSPDGFI